MSTKPFGSRAEVFHGTAEKTTGGLRAKDLMLDPNDGQIKSVAAHKAALARMKKEGKKHLTKVFKPKKGKFALQPKEGTKEYKKKIKKMM
ncbi:hypothetical protein OtV5_134 [Ostreococcus tauri virus OtV5]|uniref:Uncharacterized protein n=1 Tax=Ostreococcus tauri virus OtV5 TaxID=1785753 RepID=A9YW48_9PHYC|nr:hypothetical protein OtV5_134 [Ostreococcus tauri virus OtV5]ABY27931.2 hypothetical protein OtV5_134 [Ostreococcus tauri virus OtV5]